MSYRSDLSETHILQRAPLGSLTNSEFVLFLLFLCSWSDSRGYTENSRSPTALSTSLIRPGAQVSPKRVITHQTIHRTSPRSRNYLLVWTLLPRFYQAGSILFLLTSTSMTSLSLRGLPRLSLSFPDRCWFIGIPWRKKSQLCKIQLSISFINLADNCPQEHLNTWQLYTIECTLL